MHLQEIDDRRILSVSLVPANVKAPELFVPSMGLVAVRTRLPVHYSKPQSQQLNRTDAYFVPRIAYEWLRPDAAISIRLLKVNVGSEAVKLIPVHE